jgi:hypothetical protein
MAGTYKSGVKVKEKNSVHSKVQIATAFANQLNQALKLRAKSLRHLDAESAIPQKLYVPIEKFFETVIQASDQYKPSLKQLTTNHLKKTKALALSAEYFEIIANKALSKSNKGDRKLLVVLQNLISDVYHFIKQQEMTHHSYTLGMSPNTRPVNWELREAVNAHIIEHQKKFGETEYPNLNAAQIRARASGHKLSGRTYREIKSMHENGTLFHYVQARKRQ